MLKKNPVVKIDYQKSFELIKEAADLGYTKAIYELGFRYSVGDFGTSKDINKAIELYKKVIEIEPANSNAYTLLGNTYVMLKNLRSAIASYKQAVDIDTDNDEIKLIYIEVIQEYIKNRDTLENGEAVNDR